MGALGRDGVGYERTRVVKNPLDPAELRAAIGNVHRAGMPGVFAEVRDGNQVWRGAAGVADVASGRLVTADVRHCVGSITKTFTAAAVLQQVEGGRIGLDSPISRNLPRLVPGERGDAITVRMLINHTNRGEPAAVEQTRLLWEAAAPSHRRRAFGSLPADVGR